MIKYEVGFFYAKYFRSANKLFYEIGSNSIRIFRTGTKKAFANLHQII